MKRLIMRVSASVAILFLVVVAAFGQFNPMAPIEADPALRMGRLSNGLSYYIRHNAKPKGQADFYIISDVGAIQEEDDQQGLAHFLEHMAFNGTKNLPGKEAINYLESVGVKFGANLNASTSWDVTTYLIKDIPLKREGVIDSALLILHDWSHFIEPQPEEIDKERGVIKEELRTRDNANWRSTMELIKALGRGTKYEHRNLIGYLDQLSSFEPEALVRFYEQWYRPDYQAVIIVGDVDPEVVESKIIKLMSDIPAPAENAPKKERIVVAENAEPIVSIYTDPEMQHSSIQYIIKREATDKSNNIYTYKAYMDMAMLFISTMQNERFGEIAMREDAPFLGASMYIGSIGVIPTMESTIFGAQSKDGELPRALSALSTEVERSARHGYNEGEFERARATLMSLVKSQYANRDDKTNNSYVQRYINNFRFNTPVPSAEAEWQLDSTIVNKMTLKDVNALSKQLLTPHNHVIAIKAPQKEGITNPTEAEVLSILKETKAAEVEDFADDVVTEPLIGEDVKLSGSKVVSQSEDSRIGATVWRLANGIEVVVKPSKLKADEVLLSGESDGGASMMSDTQYYTAKYLPMIMKYSGVSKFSAVELDKQLSGKLAGVSLSVGSYSHGVDGASSVEDVETMLQLLYLYFESPRFAQIDFEVFRRQMLANIANVESDPDFLMSQRFANVVYDNNIRMQPISKDIVEGVKFEDLQSLHSRLFGDGSNFRFTIVGNVDLESLKPLVEKYIGSLRVGGSKLKYADDKISVVGGAVVDHFSTPMEQPKVSVQILYSGDMEYNLRNLVVASYLKQALDKKYLDNIREEKGGTYGVGVTLAVKNTPHERYSLLMSFDTNEGQYQELIPLIEHELEAIAKGGVDAEQLDKSKAFMVKNFGNILEHNSVWMRYITTLYEDGIDYFADYVSTVKSITSDDVARMAKRILADKNRIEVVMTPEK